jgi:hypothetical protein
MYIGFSEFLKLVKASKDKVSLSYILYSSLHN